MTSKEATLETELKESIKKTDYNLIALTMVLRERERVELGELTSITLTADEHAGVIERTLANLNQAQAEMSKQVLKKINRMRQLELVCN